MPPPDHQRDEAFQRYVAASAAYFAKVEADGDQPWFNTLEERRELFMRRYIRPAPPASVPDRTLAEIRGEHRNDQPPNHQETQRSRVA